jgi:uncharacterized protein (DUF2225 family)
MYLADVGVKCPNCGVKFNSKQLPVYVQTPRRNSELRQDFNGKNPQFEQYIICTCPSCGRADWMNSFPATKEPTVLSQPRVTPHLQFRNAGQNAERQGRDTYNAGMFYLYAAWCADDSGAYPQAREYRRLAVESFSKSLVDACCPIIHRAEIEYLIGELLRCSGELQSAREYYRSVIPKLPAKFAFMARKLTRLAEQGKTEPIAFEIQGR